MQQNFYGSLSEQNKMLYNSKELQDDVIAGIGFDWYDYGARFYDAQIGRFHTQDRFAEKYFSMTPYQYGGNNPIYFIDINGDSLWVKHRTGFLGLGKTQTLRYEDGNLYNKDGSDYTGKVRGFLKRTVKALDQISDADNHLGTNVIETLQASGHNFVIEHANNNPRVRGANEFVNDNPNASYFIAGIDEMRYRSYLQPGGSGGTIYWNPFDGSVPEVGGNLGLRRTSNLAHELFHGYEAHFGVTDNRPINGLSRMEWRASYYENQVRNHLGFPYRTHNRGVNILDNNFQPIYVPPIRIKRRIMDIRRT